MIPLNTGRKLRVDKMFKNDHVVSLTLSSVYIPFSGRLIRRQTTYLSTFSGQEILRTAAGGGALFYKYIYSISIQYHYLILLEYFYN